MSWDPSVLADSTQVLTTINNITLHSTTGGVSVNGEVFTTAHYLFVSREGIAIIVTANELLDTDLVYNYITSEFEVIYDLEFLNITYFAYSINCEPYDFFWTEKSLTFDNLEFYPTEE